MEQAAPPPPPPPPPAPAPAAGDEYPVRFSVDYPDRELNRLTTFFRVFTVIPIAIVLACVSGGDLRLDWGGATTRRRRSPPPAGSCSRHRC